MDVDVCGAGGGNSSKRKMDIAGTVEGTTEVIPLEMYDSARAKIDANLRWLFAKAYGIDHIPDDFRDPFYIDQYEQEHIKPPVLHLLLSCKLYCRVCALVLKTEQIALLQSHQSVIQAMSRKGIYVMESDDMPVTEGDLTCVPIKMSAHMPMIDALMMAYTVEMMSIEKVVACVKRFSTFSASKDLPFDLEDAMVFWINKVNMKMKEITERELKVKEHLLESPSHLKVRYRREHASCRLLPFFPLLEDLMRDVCDGAALLTVVHYYCPQLMKLDDICLKEVSSIADSLYNICLLKEFANLNLNKSFYLTMEDMVYSPLVLKHNVMVFIAELFWWFETVKPDFVQPRDLIDIKDAKAVPQPKSARPTVPISNATKRSFLVSPGVAEASLSAQSSPEVCNRDFLHPEDSDPVKGGPPFSSSHPLLPLRQRQQKQREDAGLINRSNSLTQVDGPHRCSVSDWPDKRPRTVSTLYPYSTAADSDADVASEDSMSLARSISKDSLASNKATATPSHLAPAPPRCLNDRGLQDNFRIKDEEEKEGELVAIMIPTASSQVDVLHYSDTKAKPFLSDSKSDSFFLESLMPAMLKLAKEKSVSLNKQEESGEGPSDQGDPQRGENPVAAALRKAPTSLNQTYTPSSSFELDLSIDIPRPQVARTVEHVSREPTCGFYLHKDPEEESPCQGVEAGLEKVDEEKDEQDLDEAFTTNGSAQRSFEENDDEEEESAKLKQDMSVKEHVDKDKEEGGGSGRSSPSFNGHSQACSLDSGSVRMTSFAELKALHQPFGSNHDLRSSTSSSQRTTPDGSEFSGPLATSWRLKRDQSPSSLVDSSHNLLASELVQLHMQLDKKRHAIEHQKKKMEALSAHQRQKLGKAAFLHIVKKGGGKRDMPPYPLNSERQYAKEELNRERGSKDDLYVDILHSGDKQEVPQPGALEGQRKGAGDGGFYLDEELDLNECNRSIELLNEAIGGIQQQMMQLSLQQDQLMKQNVQSPPGGALSAVHFMEPLSNKGTVPVQNPPKLTLARGSRTKPSELKLAKEQSLHSVRGAGTPVQSPGMPLSGSCLPRMEQPDSPRTPTPAKAEHLDKPSSRHRRSATYRPQVEANLRLPTSVDLVTLASPEVPFESSVLRDGELNTLDHSRKENVMSDMMSQRSRSHLIEVHLSDLKSSHEEGEGSKGDTVEGPNKEQESILGFFFKDEQKAEDELAKKRAAFLLKQQKKTEEARLRKLHLEAETEAKRDEARRKAEEDRLRKEEEKTRRELIKQAYLRRKQRELMEEQGLQGNAKTKTKQKPRPKPAFTRVESYSDTVSKFSSTASDNLSSTRSGSSLSLASAATNKADSVNSAGGGSQKDESVETFPGTSRNAKRNAERDWDNGSTASSITSVAEYTGPKLFKEPSTKSNKPIIHNAISHCCLAGKVNEPQKNSILEELEKSESNHLMILFRDGGCQFRALYSYFPDTEEIVKLTGTGPKSIGKKMIEKLYKYNSDRKQFTVIPAKTVSVSVDALTIHNHLWQAKRTTLPKKTVK